MIMVYKMPTSVLLEMLSLAGYDEGSGLVGGSLQGEVERGNSGQQLARK